MICLLKQALEEVGMVLMPFMFVRFGWLVVQRGHQAQQGPQRNLALGTMGK